MTTPQTTAPPTRLLSVAEIAKRLSVGKRTVYNLRYRGGSRSPFRSRRTPSAGGRPTSRGGSPAVRERPARWPSALKPGAPFPLAWVRPAPVRGAAKSVLQALASRADSEGVCWPSLRTLDTDSGFGVTTVCKALRELEKDGWIRREQRKKRDGGPTSTKYTIALHRTGHIPVKGGTGVATVPPPCK